MYIYAILCPQLKNLKESLWGALVGSTTWIKKSKSNSCTLSRFITTVCFSISVFKHLNKHHNSFIYVYLWMVNYLVLIIKLKSCCYMDAVSISIDD